jgi:hypothetical protein
MCRTGFLKIEDGFPDTDSLPKAGGDVSAVSVFLDKISVGSTELTRMHHGQTTLFQMRDGTGVSVIWRLVAQTQGEVRPQARQK